jgi:uncharacterized protein (TIGR00255 family)
MALKSMTGFGRGEATAKGIRAEAEVSSVNRRQLDVRVVLPRAFSSLESLCQKAVCRSVSRGSVNVAVRIVCEHTSGRGAVSVDLKLARAYMRELKQAAKALQLKNDITASSLLRLPDVLHSGVSDMDPSAAWPAVKKALGIALEALCAMRAKEGDSLEKDLSKRFAELGRVWKALCKLAPSVTRRYRSALQQRLRRSGVDIKMGDPSLVKELALFAERSDISEELVRLESHLEQVGRNLALGEPVGRTLDFLCQELLREINTVGSKANDVKISGYVIRFKSTLEAAREQVQNVE